MLNKISAKLDTIADSLEAKGFMKEAYEIDKVADMIEANQDFKTYTPDALPKTEEAEIAASLISKLPAEFKFFTQDVGPAVSWGIPSSFSIQYINGPFMEDNTIRVIFSVIKKRDGLVVGVWRGRDLIERFANVTEAQWPNIRDTITEGSFIHLNDKDPPVY